MDEKEILDQIKTITRKIISEKIPSPEFGILLTNEEYSMQQTDIILIHSYQEKVSSQWSFNLHELINSFLSPRPGLKMLPMACTGGDHAMTNVILSGSYEDLPMSPFILFVKGLPWQYRDSLQLLYKHSDENKFVMVHL